MIEKLRNIAIIAHVDHGKTTLVDKLLQQSGTLENRGQVEERVMDTNALEKERGITILAKNTTIEWQGYRINIVDTPGHADFGGEVERIMSMVDSVLLLVDAVDGPMPQTRFVTEKAFLQGLKPIVVVNKIDRPGARADWAVDQVFDLFDRLGASDEQLDFPVMYTSALAGYATEDPEQVGTDMQPLFELIVNQVPPPEVDSTGPFQMQISSLDYSSYVGTIGIGRIKRGQIKTNTQVSVVSRDGSKRQGRVLQILGHLGLKRIEVAQAGAGDIVCVTGLEKLHISDTLCDVDHSEALTPLTVDEPTVSMNFCVNDSPFAGKEGRFVTSRQIKERLEKELLRNVALRVVETDDPDKFKVSGRGELHLAILIETMRREGFELAVSRPEVIIKEVDGVQQEPYEFVTIDIDDAHQGTMMEKMGARQGDLKNMVPDGKGRVRLEFVVPARGLIGFQTEFLSSTSGTGIIHHLFDHYGPLKPSLQPSRQRGAMIASTAGKALGYSLFTLQERGSLMISPGVAVYEGMLVGIHSRDNDLVVNVTKAKKLSNVRAAGTDENIVLTPPMNMTLERALETIADDELVEVTPESIRLRKKKLTASERKRD